MEGWFGVGLELLNQTKAPLALGPLLPPSADPVKVKDELTQAVLLLGLVSSPSADPPFTVGVVGPYRCRFDDFSMRVTRTPLGLCLRHW